MLQVVEGREGTPRWGGSSFTLFTDVIGVDLDNSGETTGKKVAAK